MDLLNLYLENVNKKATLTFRKHRKMSKYNWPLLASVSFLFLLLKILCEYIIQTFM